jgi:cyclase
LARRGPSIGCGNVIRIIPRLDIKGPNLVKGIHMEGLRVLGSPAEFARAYYEQGADELLFVDIVASLYGRNSLLPIVEQAANELFVPLAVGGGIRSADDVQAVLRAGADKVTINTAAVRRPELIGELASRFGSANVVVVIEAMRRPNGRYEAFTDNGRSPTGLDVVQWAERVAQLGAGELVITSINQEGTKRGFDVELTKSVLGVVDIPVIAHGGGGSLEDVAAVAATGVDAIALASLFHYKVADAQTVKRFLCERGFQVRL